MRRLLSLAAALTVTFAPLTAGADPSSDLQKTAEAFAALHSWHATMVSQGRTTECDFVAPDRFKLTTPMGPAYVIGSDIYLSMGGKYMKMPVPMMTSMVSELRSPSHIATFAKSHKVQDLGDTSVGGVATHAYAFDDNTNGIATHVVIDVAKSDSLPRRQVVTYAKGSTTITYRNFNAPLTINAPT
ncbi:MAG: hypothetical protein JOZ86_04525 [Candidatus Eremiobacteraeota bacterium]|nr:hypothetical protein [Candidatus Eremiobacteraeota bacterium]